MHNPQTMPDRVRLMLACEADTHRLGRSLAEFLPAGAVVGLTGTLGAGKTRLVQAIAEGAGIDPSTVLSPTFVLVHEYPFLLNGNGSTLYHLDAYRIRDDDEFLALGPEEFFNSGGWTFVEWADRVAACLPTDRLHIDMLVRGPDERECMISAHGDLHRPIVAQIAARFAVNLTADTGD